jgi:acyl-CoA synthetase (AMP-forming)/AMP-acid ligase II
MAPASFLQTPVRWLQAITRYKATHSAAPNFAYELCARRITPEQRETLDLSSWQMALNGAEPIRPEVLELFSQVFEPCGFNPTAFCPGYGLAEATLKVTAVNVNDKPTFYRVQADALQENKVITAKEDENQDQTKILVGCGFTQIDTQIIIVNPDTLSRCAPDEIGEIWVSGKTVAQGYWQRFKETRETFHAYLADTKKGPFLRTGDLGFLKEGELFITGRLKDVLIIRGRNHYPQDIELTVEENSIELIPHRSAAFTIELDGQEKLVIAAEIERRYHDRRQKASPVPLTEEQRKARDRREEDSLDQGFTVELSEPPVFDTVVSKIKQAVAVHHGLQVHRVLLLRVGTIPKTSSGKIQRYACRQGFLEGTLNLVYDSQNLSC